MLKRPFFQKNNFVNGQYVPNHIPLVYVYSEIAFYQDKVPP